MLKLQELLVKCSKSSNRLLIFPRVMKFSSQTLAEEKHTIANHFESELSESQTKSLYKHPAKASKTNNNNNLVAAAFASLNNPPGTIADIETPFTDDKISKACTVDELLSISEGNGVSRRHALKVVSVLANWTSLHKINLSDFETDNRFIRLCKVLTKVSNKNRNYGYSRSEDLSTVLSITADDEAAKLISSITLPQMVKVMTTLSVRKRRSTLLLRALAYHITGSPEHLTIKQSADLLYSMSGLNFPDENLLSRVCNDVCDGLDTAKLEKSSPIGSILTSLGLLRYKNPVTLDALCNWMVDNHNICRSQDVFGLFMTLAVLNYIPTNFEKLLETFLPQLTFSEAGTHIQWLENVWSLVLLNHWNSKDLSSVLDQHFLLKLIENEDPSNVSLKLKCLNISGAALHLSKEYKGCTLPESSPIRNVKIPRTKEKNDFVNSIIETLKNLIQSQNYLRTNVDTGLGFYIDAECVLDKKGMPLELESRNAEGTKVAILALDYHDMCRGKIEPTGINSYAIRLLEAQGYKVLTIPFVDFNSKVKLINRVQYLESKLKEIVNL